MKTAEVVLARRRERYATDSAYREKMRANARAHVRTRSDRLQYTFGITEEEYDILLEAQGGVCAICRTKSLQVIKGIVSAMPVDHDHTTKKVRAILCASCNSGLGYFQDDPERMRAAARYIEAQRGC